MKKLNKTFIISIILLLLFVFMGFSKGWGAQVTIKEKNGYDWEAHTHLFKLGYIEGYIASVSRLIEFLTKYLERIEVEATNLAPIEANSDKAVVLLKLIDAIRKTIMECELYNITVGQMVSGLDEFYKDYRNKQIFVTDAIYIVKMEIRGASQEEIAEAKRVLRMTSTERQKYYEEKEKKEKTKENKEIEKE